jgi:hypothetical protein
LIEKFLLDFFLMEISLENFFNKIFFFLTDNLLEKFILKEEIFLFFDREFHWKNFFSIEASFFFDKKFIENFFENFFNRKIFFDR